MTLFTGRCDSGFEHGCHGHSGLEPVETGVIQWTSTVRKVLKAACYSLSSVGKEGLYS